MATARIADLVKIASDLSCISKDAILGESRLRHIVRVRQAVAYVAVEQGVHSLPQIGRELGGRDHSTIRHGHQTAEAVAARDPEYALFVAAIRRRAGILRTKAPVKDYTFLRPVAA